MTMHAIELLKQHALILDTCNSLECMDNDQLRETVRSIKKIGKELVEKMNRGGWRLLEIGVIGGLATLTSQFTTNESMKAALTIVGKGISESGTQLVNQLNQAEQARLKNDLELENFHLQQAVKTLEKINQFITQHDHYVEAVQRSSFQGFPTAH